MTADERIDLRERPISSESWLKAVLKAISQLIWTADTDGRRYWVSDSFAAYVGLQFEHCLGSQWGQFVHPDDCASFEAALGAGGSDDDSCIAEVRLLGADNSYSWFLSQVTPQFGSDGAPLGLTGTFTDISRRKKMEEALRSSQDGLRLGIGVARLGLSEIDYTEGVHHLSKEAAMLFGLGDRAMSVPREVVRSVLHPDDRRRLDELNAESLKSGAAWFEMDHRVILHDGQIKHLRMRKLNFFEGEGESRKLVRGSLAFFDIGESKRAEAELRASEERLRLGIGVAKLALIDVDYVQGTAHLSADAAGLYGLGSEDMTVPRAALHGTFHPEDAPGLLDLISRALEPDSPKRMEVEHRVLLPDGEVRWLRVRKEITFDGKSPLKSLVAAFDITASKRAEQAMQDGARRFRELAGGVAHDFNNLLTAISLHASMGAETVTDATSLQHMQAILRAAQTAASITRQLLTLSGSHVVANTETLNVNERIKRMVEVSSLALGLNMHVDLTLAADAGCVRMSGSHFDQILLNLLLNARDAMPDGGQVSISTTLINTRDPKDGMPDAFTRLTISDNGVGVPPETLPHIFEPYFTTKGGSKGTGLGLAIVHAIVTGHGGDIAVRSTPGAGTSFEISLPRCLGRDSSLNDATRPAPPVLASANCDMKTILVAEDDDDIREMLQAWLTGRGFHVLSCRDGQYAMELSECVPGRIDLLITDVRMPRMGGITLAHTLLQTRPDLEVLLITGHTGGNIANLEDLAPGWGILQKPFSLEDLLRHVDTLTSQSNRSKRADCESVFTTTV